VLFIYDLACSGFSQKEDIRIISGCHFSDLLNLNVASSLIISVTLIVGSTYVNGK